MPIKNQQGSKMGRGLTMVAWWPEFYPWNPLRVGRRDCTELFSDLHRYTHYKIIVIINNLRLIGNCKDFMNRSPGPFTHFLPWPKSLSTDCRLSWARWVLCAVPSCRPPEPPPQSRRSCSLHTRRLLIWCYMMVRVLSVLRNSREIHIYSITAQNLPCVMLNYLVMLTNK